MAKTTLKEESSAFSLRLKKALTNAGVRHSATVVANEFNLRYWGRSITPHTARTWLMGISIPMQDKLRVLSEWLQVNPDELRFGTSSAPRHTLREASINDYMFSLQDREMLNRYVELPLENKKIVQQVVTALYLTKPTHSPHTDQG